MRPHHTTTSIPAQSKAKSIADLTPYELSQIDVYQDRNRRFTDDDRDLSIRFSLDEEFGYYELED
jgi:hypothetical protein